MSLLQYSYPTRSPYSLGYRRSPWTGLENEIGRIFQTALGSDSSDTPFPVEIYEDANAAYVRADLPGVTREAIGIELAGGLLTISAVRKQKTGETEQTTSFKRALSVAEQVQSDQISAAYENGVLTVTLPKREEAKPKKITVAVK